MTRCWLNTALIILLASGSFGMQAQEQKTTPSIAPSARLAAAKSAFVRRLAGSDVPYNVILSSLEGWGRFTLVDSPDQADIVLEISAPEDAGPGVSASADRSAQRPSAAREALDVRMAVYDRKTRVLLWSGAERPKSAWRKKTNSDNLVDAAEKLVSRFRDQIEPLPGK